MIWVLVAIGGAVGSVLRYGTNRVAVHYFGADTVLGIMVVNVVGSFALGFLATSFIERIGLPIELRAMATVGLLGGFTTFSTLAYDGARLLSGGEYSRAVISLAANIFLGLGAAWLGVLAARATT